MKTEELGKFDIYINDGNYGNIYPDKEYFLDEGVPFLSATDFEGKVFNYEGIKHVSEELHFDLLTKGHLKIGDVLIVVRGNGIGKVGYFKDKIGECNINAQLAFIRTNPDELNSEFLYYMFSSEVYREIIKKFGSGSAQPQLPINRLKLVPVILREIEEQKKIAKVLSDLDAKIELNNKINTELEAMAKLIYDYWFVQFDFPDENGKPYKSSGGKMVYNEELKREIPEGWEVNTLDSFIVSNRGVSYSSKNIGDEGIPMINLNSFNTDSSYKQEGIKFFLGDYGDNKVLKPLDLVMCNTQQTAINFKTDIIGKSFLVPDIFEGDIVSSHHVTTIKVGKENLKYYLNSLFNSEHFHKYISGYATGTNILGLIFSGVESYKTEVPPDGLLDQFKSIVQNGEKKKSITIKENKKLAKLRDWLLPMLMNGQVTVN